MEDEAWRESTLERLKQILQPDNHILSLSLYGSLANLDVEKDKWSDIDVLLVIEDDVLEKYYPSVDWLKPLGQIFVLQQSASNQTQSTKVIFLDFRKIDIVIATKSKVMEGDPFWIKQKFVFSNSEEIKHILEEKASSTTHDNLNSYDIDKLANDFWFIAFVVVTKVIRNDLLIALHLALDLYRYCLVLGMWLRDKETGTYIHRTGGVKNDLIGKMDIKIEDLSKEGILVLVEKCGQEFDKLALEWSQNYIQHFSLFEGLLRQARKKI